MDDDGGGRVRPGAGGSTSRPRATRCRRRSTASLGLADWLSLGHWALVGARQGRRRLRPRRAGGDVDRPATGNTWPSRPRAIRHLKLFTDRHGGCRGRLLRPARHVWDGIAAQAAELTSCPTTASMREAADMLDIASKGYADVAQGLYGVGQGRRQPRADPHRPPHRCRHQLPRPRLPGSWTLIGAAIGDWPRPTTASPRSSRRSRRSSRCWRACVTVRRHLHRRRARGRSAQPATGTASTSRSALDNNLVR